jgi:methylaspartate mutase sigma subunit
MSSVSFVSGEKTKSATLIIGVIGEDVHVVGIRILEYALSDAGFKVVSLGAQVSQEEFIEAAVETKADAILVSSFSGHAESLANGFREKCEEAGLDNIVLLIGGYLLLEQKPWEEVEKKYIQMGFNGVYPPNTTPTRVVEDLRQRYFGSKEATR